MKDIIISIAEHQTNGDGDRPLFQIITAEVWCRWWIRSYQVRLKINGPDNGCCKLLVEAKGFVGIVTVKVPPDGRVRLSLSRTLLNGPPEIWVAAKVKIQ